MSVAHAPGARREVRPIRVMLATDDSESARAGEEWILRLRWRVPPVVDVVCVAGQAATAADLVALVHPRGATAHRTVTDDRIAVGAEASVLLVPELPAVAG